MRYLLGHAVWLGAFLILFYTAGALLLRGRLRQSLPEPFLERTLVVLAFGAAAWIGIVFALASLGWLRPGLLWGAAAIVAAGGALSMRVAIATRQQARSPGIGAGWRLPAAPCAVLLGALVPVTAVLFLQALRPDVAWDANVYHLTVPRLYLEQGGFVRIPFNVYSNWPLATDLLYALAMALADHVTAKTLHFAFGLLSALLAAALVWRDGERATAWSGWLAAALVLANPVVLYEIRVAYVDLAYAFFLGMAFLLLCRALDQQDHRARSSALLLCGLACGVLAGIKLNGFFGLVALAGLLVLEGSRRPGQAGARLRRTLRELLLLGLPAVVLLLPWVAKSLILTGNPVYPFFYDLLGGGEWSEALARQHAGWQRSIGMGRGVLDYLLLPVRVIVLGDFGYHRFDGALSPLWIVWIPLAIWRTDRLGRRALWVALLYFLLWSVSSQQTRLLIPVLPLLAVATGRSAASLVGGLAQGPLRRSIEVALSLLVGMVLVQSAWIYLVQTPRLARDLWRHGHALEAAVVHPVYHFVNQQLPEEANLLMVNHNHGFFVHRSYLADSFFEASQVAETFSTQQSADEVDRTLRELGVTHLLLERRDRGLRFGPAFVQFLSDPERVQEVYRSPDGRFLVLQVLGAAG